MEKMELLKRLRKVGLGEAFQVNGEPFLVSERVSYLEWPDRWFDLVHYQPDGRELVIEWEGQEVSRWQQVMDVNPKLVQKRIVNYHDETYRLEPEDSGVAETILRKMEDGKEISKTANTPYTTFVAPSGRRLCREIWDGKECWYFFEPALITILF